jgi:hypothetical protein
MKEYMKKYRLENKDKIIKANKRYWDKRHSEEERKDKKIEGGRVDG